MKYIFPKTSITRINYYSYYIASITRTWIIRQPLWFEQTDLSLRVWVIKPLALNPPSPTRCISHFIPLYKRQVEHFQCRKTKLGVRYLSQGLITSKLCIAGTSVLVICEVVLGTCMKRWEGSRPHGVLLIDIK